MELWLKKYFRRFMVLDLLLAVGISLVAFNVVSIRQEGELPQISDSAWQKLSNKFKSGPVTSRIQRIEKKNVLKTLRSGIRRREKADAIGQYELVGSVDGRAYFQHKKTQSLAIIAIGEKLEGWQLTNMDDTKAEMEKDGKIIEITR